MAPAQRLSLAGVRQQTRLGVSSQLDKKNVEEAGAISLEDARSTADSSKLDFALAEIRPETRSACGGNSSFLQNVREDTPAGALGTTDRESTSLSAEARLTTLWHNSSTKGKEQACFSNIGELGSSRAHQPKSYFDSASEDLVKSFIPSLFDSESDCEDGISNPSAQTADDIPDCSEANSHTTTLHWQNSSPLSSALSSGVDTSSQDSYGNRACHPAFQTVPSFQENSLGLADMSGFNSMASVSPNILDSRPSDDERQSKKSKIERTQPHRSGDCKVVNVLGNRTLAPTRVREHTGDSAAGLTSQNAASSLYNTSTGKRVMAGSLGLSDLHETAAKAAALCAAPISTAPSHTVPQSPALGVPLSAAWQPVPSQYQSPQGGLAIKVPGPWPAPPGMIPTAPFTAFYPQQISQHAPPCAVKPPPATSQAVNVTAALAELLDDMPKMKPPLGLKLDKNSVLEELNRLQAGSVVMRS